VLRRWGRETQNFGFFNCVDKLTTVSKLKAIVSSISPSSEQIKELRVLTQLINPNFCFKQKNIYTYVMSSFRKIVTAKTHINPVNLNKKRYLVFITVLEITCQKELR